MFCRKCGTENLDGVNYCKSCGDNLIGGETKSSSLEIANPWKRLAAALVDGVILSAVFIPIYIVMVVSAINSGESLNFEDINGRVRVVQLIGIFVGWLYYVLQESSEKQATVGKRILGIIVADRDGNRLSFARATGRHFAKMLSAITCYIGFLMVLFTKNKQGLHDLIASTYAYEKN